MPNGSVFPIYLRAEYDGRTGFRDMERDATQSVDRTKRLFESAYSEINATISRALSGPRNTTGALDVGVAGLRESARASQERAQAAQEMAVAIRRAAEAEGDYSTSARASVAAAEALAVEHRQAAAAALTQAAAAEQVQTQLNRLAVAQGGVSRGHLTLIEGGRGVVASAGQQRQAMIGVGQQLQDLGVSFAGGIRPSIAFAQQLPQLAFAMSNMGGVAGRIGTFFSGPWGVALTLGAVAMGPLIDGLFESAFASGEADDAAKQLAERQAELANFFDLATGAIKEQNQTLIQNAILARGDTIDSLREGQTARRAEIRRLVRGSDDGLAVVSPEGFGVDNLPGNPDLVRRLTAAGGNQARIDRELRTLATSNSSNAATARRISDLRAEAVTAARDIARLTAESASLDSGRLSRSLITPGRPRRERSGRGEGDAAANRLAQLREQGEDAARAIAGIVDGFDRTPAAIARANSAMARLDDIASDLERRRPPNYSALVQQLAEARDIVANGLAAEFDQRLRQGEQDLAVAALRSQGLDDQAEALALQNSILREIGATSEAELATALQTNRIGAERYAQLQAQRAAYGELNREAERLYRTGESVRAQLEQVNGIRSTIERSVELAMTDPGRAIEGLFTDIRQQFRSFFARNLTESLFGSAFAELDAEINPRVQADRLVAAASKPVVTQFEAITTAARDAAAALSAVAANDAAARAVRGGFNDFTNRSRAFADSAFGEGDIVVTGRRLAKPEPLPTINADPTDIFGRTFRALFERYLGKGSPLARDFGSILSGYAQGGPLGAGINGLGALLGGDSPLGRAVSGLSKSLPQIAAAMEVNSAISSLLGGDEVKNGKFFGQFAPFLTPLLGSALRGSATISGSADNFAVAVRGNSGRYRSASEEGAESVIATVQQIAERLGGTVDASRGSVSIGVRKGDYRVDPTGRGITKTKRGAIDFGEDAEAAARAAAIDLIKDGVIVGLREGTKRLIEAGKDLDAQLQKALDYESVFERLKAIDNPVAAALDTLDKEFSRLNRIFGEAGAATADYAELERLYGIDRARLIREAGESAIGGLRGLFDSLTVGNDARSLRERQGFARANYDPLAARVAAGDRSAYEDFSQAAQQLLDIQRQISGSTNDYFGLLDQVTALTKTRIDSETNIASIAAGRTSPFDSSGTPAGVVDGSASVVNAIDRQTAQLSDVFLSGLSGLGGDIIRSIYASQQNGTGTAVGFRTAAAL